MELARASEISRRVVGGLSSFCERIEVAGSIRRQRPFVHDIDIVCIPSAPGAFIGALQQLGQIKTGGGKNIRVQLPEIMLDVYVATPGTWSTLLLIRTGSAKHNVYLCTRARSKGMKLHADGSGLFKVKGILAGSPVEERIAGDTEESIFQALGLGYKDPADREMDVRGRPVFEPLKTKIRTKMTP